MLQKQIPLEELRLWVVEIGLEPGGHQDLFLDIGFGQVLQPRRARRVLGFQQVVVLIIKSLIAELVLVFPLVVAENEIDAVHSSFVRSFFLQLNEIIHFQAHVLNVGLNLRLHLQVDQSVSARTHKPRLLKAFESVFVLTEVLQLDCHVIIGDLERYPEVFIYVVLNLVLEVNEQLQAVAGALVGLLVLALVAQTSADVEHRVDFLVNGDVELVFEQQDQFKMLFGHLVEVEFLVEASEVVQSYLDELALGLGV